MSDGPESQAQTYCAAQAWPGDAVVVAKVRDSIACALFIFHNAEWREWAEGWANGTDRTPQAAEKAYAIAAQFVPAGFAAIGKHVAKAASCYLSRPTEAKIEAGEACLLAWGANMRMPCMTEWAKSDAPLSAMPGYGWWERSGRQGG